MHYFAVVQIAFPAFFLPRKKASERKNAKGGCRAAADKNRKVFICSQALPPLEIPHTRPAERGKRNDAHFPIPGMSPRNGEKSPTHGFVFY